MKKMKDQVYIRFTNTDPRNHNSKDSMTGQPVDGVYCYRMDLENPHMSNNEIMKCAAKFAQNQMSDVHTWGYARQSEGEFVVFTGRSSGNGRDGQVAIAEEIIGWRQIEIK